jgi:hypothetical protein
MENVYNFTYVPRYLSDDRFFFKTHFKTYNNSSLDLPKNSNFHFLTSKVVDRKEQSKDVFLDLNVNKKLLSPLRKFRKKLKL